MAVGGQKGEVRRKTRHPSPNTSTFAVTQALVTLLTSDNWGDRLMQSLAVGNLLPGGKYYCKPGYYAPGLKGPPGASSNWIVRLSVCPSVCNSVPLTKKVQYLKFGW